MYYLFEVCSEHLQVIAHNWILVCTEEDFKSSKKNYIENPGGNNSCVVQEEGARESAESCAVTASWSVACLDDWGYVFQLCHFPIFYLLFIEWKPDSSLNAYNDLCVYMLLWQEYKF